MSGLSENLFKMSAPQLLSYTLGGEYQNVRFGEGDLVSRNFSGLPSHKTSPAYSPRMFWEVHLDQVCKESGVGKSLLLHFSTFWFPKRA